LNAIAEPWELLGGLRTNGLDMPSRAPYYQRFIALAAQQTPAQQDMLIWQAHQVFHVRIAVLRLDIRRCLLITQIERRSTRSLPWRDVIRASGRWNLEAAQPAAPAERGTR
jgi:hypothetical protein